MAPVAYMSAADAEKLARHYSDSGIRVSGHAWTRLEERDFDLQDIRKVLKSGYIYKPPEQDIKRGDWKYRMEGYSVDNRELILIICFKQEPSTFVITVFPDEQ